MDSIGQRFIQALEGFEANGDDKALIALFSERAEISNVATHEGLRGKDGARQFWREYRGTLKDVRSTFRNCIESGSRVALEWNTTGVSFNGAQIDYDGTSILEWDEAGECILRFTAYFDPRAVGQDIGSKLGASSGPPVGTPSPTAEGRTKVPATVPA